MSKRHTFELAQRLTRLLGTLPPREARRRRRGELGTLVEQARDEYLAELDADDGLAVLTIGADAIVAAAEQQTRRAQSPARRGSRRRR